MASNSTLTVLGDAVISGPLTVSCVPPCGFSLAAQNISGTFSSVQLASPLQACEMLVSPTTQTSTLFSVVVTVDRRGCPSGNDALPVGAIAGIAAGGVVLLLLLVALPLGIYRMRQKKQLEVALGRV